jgi:predicted O-methyltransferase YrrM
MGTLAGLMATIEHVTPEGGAWCDVDKASHLAALVLALRPRTIVEIGVFLGGSLIPMALAQQRYAEPGIHKTIAIDPWAAGPAIEGELDAKHVDWWGKVDYELTLARFVRRIEKHGLTELVQIMRRPSNDVTPPAPLDLCHIDGNHREQAVTDVERFAPNIPPGGILVLDDLEWSGAHVQRAYSLAQGLGFRTLYKLGTGCAMIRA